MLLPPFVRHIIAYLSYLPAGEGLLLGGSYGRGDADILSDVDLIYVCAPHQVEPRFQDIIAHCRNQQTVVFHKVIAHSRTLNLITHVWERVDISVVDRDDLKSYAGQILLPLFDRTDLESCLLKDQSAEKDTIDIAATVSECIRIAGLLPVVAGRDDWVTAQTGGNLLRDLLIKVLLVENGHNTKHGALSLKKHMHYSAISILENLPPLFAHPESIKSFYKAVIDAFLPIARKLMQHQGAEWPEKFHAATRAHLEKTFGNALGL